MLIVEVLTAELAEAVEEAEATDELAAEEEAATELLMAALATDEEEALSEGGSLAAPTLPALLLSLPKMLRNGLSARFLIIRWRTT